MDLHRNNTLIMWWVAAVTYFFLVISYSYQEQMLAEDSDFLRHRVKYNDILEES